MRRMGGAGVVSAVVFLTVAGAAWGKATTVCVPQAPSTPVLSTNTNGECPPQQIGKGTVKYTSEALPGPAELEKLDKILPHVNYVETGVGGKTTIQFSGINVQVVNGAGKTASRNGAGNLVIGYDEGAGAQTGSHSLVLGSEQAYTGWGAIVAGTNNTAAGAYDVVFGFQNVAEGAEASVTGGFKNKAGNLQASVSGGSGNVASGSSASISGGVENVASGRGSSVSGGTFNIAQGEESSVTGGEVNEARYRSSVSGGSRNRATSTSWIGGGYRNFSSGGLSSIFGGSELTANEEFQAIP
jgi:hypothetical protein